MFSSDESLSDNESVSDLSDLEEKPYFRKMDKYDTIEIKDIPYTNENEVEIFDETLRQQYLKEGDQKKIEKDKEKDQTYKEILEWDISLPPQNVVIYSSDKVEEVKPKLKCELVEMILKSKKTEKSEYEITPPGNIVGENDKIMYPRRLSGSISDPSTHIKNYQHPSQLKMTQSFTVFQKCNNVVIQEAPSDEKKAEDEKLKNTRFMIESISKLRANIADFQKDMEEFTEKSKFLARAFEDKCVGTETGHEIKLVQQGIMNQTKFYCLIKHYGNVNYNRVLNTIKEDINEDDVMTEDDCSSVATEKLIQTDPIPDVVEEKVPDNTRRNLKYESLQQILADEKRILKEIEQFSHPESNTVIKRKTNRSLEMQLAME